MAGKVTLDMKPLAELRRQLKQVQESHVRVGFFDSKPHPEEPFGLDLPTIANIQEFGAPEANIPKRPFMRETFRVTKIWHAVKERFALVMAGKNTDIKYAIYDFVGRLLKKEMQQNIADWSEPMNAPRTVAHKGFNNPLIETGFMRDNVEHRVERK